MDPNYNLKEMRELAAKMIKDYHAEDSNGIDQEDAASMAELFEALDHWLMKGGFFPKEWREANEGFNKNA